MGTSTGWVNGAWEYLVVSNLLLRIIVSGLKIIWKMVNLLPVYRLVDMNHLRCLIRTLFPRDWLSMLLIGVQRARDKSRDGTAGIDGNELKEHCMLGSQSCILESISFSLTSPET